MEFAALNRETPSERVARAEAGEKRATREAQESRCLQRYRQAISLQQAGETEKARELYREILGSQVMEEARDSSTSGTLQRLRFLALKNLGSIARSYGDDSAALDAFIQAVEVDSGEVTVWYQLALAATNLGNLLLARTALEEARKCQAHHWPVIELLCTVLLALDDTSACLQLISEALTHCPQFPRGLAYLHHLTETSPDLLTFIPSLRLQLMKPHPPDKEKLVNEAMELARRCGHLAEVKVLEEPIKPPRPLAYYSLHSLGQSLALLYHHCRHLTRPSLASPVDVRLLSEGTSDAPLLPRLVCQAPPTSEEVSSEEVSGAELDRREGKRKISDIPQPVLPKRRSTRVKSRREQVSASERFARFLPEGLRGCEFGDVCALSPLSHEAPVTPLTDQSDFSSALKLRLPNEVVKAYLQDHQNNSGVISLIYDYLLLLAQHYNWQWSEASFSVVRVFMELYESLLPHLTFPSPLCSSDDVEFTRLQDMAMICLCYSELKLDSLQRSPSVHPPTSLSHALTFSQMACGGSTWRGSSEFALRVSWCVYKKMVVVGDMRGALAALRKCQHLLETGCTCQILPNLRLDSCISPVQVSQKMRCLEQLLASEEVDTLFKAGDHSGVVSCLRPMLDWKSENHSQLLLGREEGESPVSLLLTSLLALERWQECLLCGVTALQELLLTYQLGNKRWVSALHSTYTHIDKCLEEGPSGLVRQSEERVQRHLAVCVFRTLDLQIEMTDSPLFHLMPLALPLTVLYNTLLSLHESSDVAMETAPESKSEEVPMETKGDMLIADSPVQSSSQEGSKEEHGHWDERGREEHGHWGLQFLCEAHDHLGGGGLGWCVAENGRLLKTLVCRLREELRLLTAHPPKTRETLLRELEQCYYCLYGHPHKKAKAWGLQDHGAEQLPLTWESAQYLLEFYHPSFLPAVEENKALTPELVSLYRRVVEVIPETGKVIPLPVIAGYIKGSVEELPLPSLPAPHTALVSEIFYLLADDALKSNEFFSALHHYTQSVCYSPERVDTWAGLALARARTVMKKLDRRDVRSGIEGSLHKQVTPILRCFKRALALGSQHHYVSEKYGLFCYTIQSYCSQIVSMPELYSGKTELVSWAKWSGRGLLELARQCFTSDLCQVGRASRPWFYGLVAAKAGRKLGLSPSASLPLLISVAKQQCSGSATPPAVIELRGQWMTSVEVHYQIFCCALKLFPKWGEAAVAKELGDWQGLPLCRVEYPGVREWVLAVLRGRKPYPAEEEWATRPLVAGATDSVTRLVQKVIADAEREVSLETGSSVSQSPTSVLERCVYGVALATVRCPAYYKSLYRLAAIFHQHGHSKEAQSLLLGPLPQALLRAQDKIQPLFVLKPNVFANFWQIPVEEINRPGRFSSFARASLQLLCDVLSQQKDSASLLLLAQHLRCRPDSSRQYLRDYERVVMYQKAIQYCTTVHQQILKGEPSLVHETHFQITDPPPPEQGKYSDDKLKALLIEANSLRTLSYRADSRQLSLTETVDHCLEQCYHVCVSRIPHPGGSVVSTKGSSTIEEAIRLCQIFLRQHVDRT